MSQTTTTIFKKLANLEQQVQKLKVQAYLNLPKSQQTVSLYPQNSINKALKNTRNQIWQEKYAKKVKSLS
jgi:hypothetical protein